MNVLKKKKKKKKNSKKVNCQLRKIILYWINIRGLFLNIRCEFVRQGESNNTEAKHGLRYRFYRSLFFLQALTLVLVPLGPRLSKNRAWRNTFCIRRAPFYDVTCSLKGLTVVWSYTFRVTLMLRIVVKTVDGTPWNLTWDRVLLEIYWMPFISFFRFDRSKWKAIVRRYKFETFHAICSVC